MICLAFPGSATSGNRTRTAGTSDHASREGAPKRTDVQLGRGQQACGAICNVRRGKELRWRKAQKRYKTSGIKARYPFFGQCLVLGGHVENPQRHFLRKANM